MTLSMQLICRLEDIPDGGAREFATETDAPYFAVRQGSSVYVYRNRCPHAHTPLNWMPDRFLTKDKDLIICASHGALFTIASGTCVGGPCAGQQLDSIAVEVNDEGVWVTPAGG